jgi:broad specificity polyphosphatase/5'/3'-nucleotidase SurE
MSTALSKVRAVALSYGIVVHPTPAEWTQPAHDLGGRIIKHLWHNWGQDDCGLRNGEVDLYNVNIPLVEKIVSEKGLDVYWTKMWRNSYGRLFKQIPPPERCGDQPAINPAGPDADTDVKEQADINPGGDEYAANLVFKWGPEMKGLISPNASLLPIGSDGWAIHKGGASVTALRASFGEPLSHEVTDADAVLWKMKL